MIKTPTEVIVKIVSHCNLNCTYCYNHDNERAQIMDKKTVAKIITGMCREMDPSVPLTFLWHGGEPLMAGLDYFKFIVSCQRQFPNKIINLVQTNAMLLDDEFLDFFEKNGFRVGFSLDYPQEVHDSTRPSRAGQPTFERILANIEKAKQRAFAGGIILVLNKKNLASIEEIYRFFRAREWHLKINPLINVSHDIDQSPELTLTAEEYGTAMVQLFNMWAIDDKCPIRLDILDHVVDMIMTGTPQSCNFMHSCQQAFIGFNAEGKAFPCTRVEEISKYCYGDINTMSIAQIWQNRNSGIFSRAVNLVDASCGKCEFFSICHGGCFNNVLLARKAGRNKDPYCLAYKMIFMAVKDRTNAILSQYGLQCPLSPKEVMTLDHTQIRDFFYRRKIKGLQEKIHDLELTDYEFWGNWGDKTHYDHYDGPYADC